MQVNKASSVLVVLAVLPWMECFAAESGGVPARPDFVALRDFSWKSLAEPENLFYPAYFWLWNGPLDPDVLRRQLHDMAAHDTRSVCVLPMPREFRPSNTNNQMDVDYLSPEYFKRVKVAVAEAARLGMNYWLYDEGGWPSGEAGGRVVGTRPDTIVQTLNWDSSGKGQWKPGTGGGADLMNPQATETFIKLTHDRYADAVGSEFGKTIKMLFTDEPCKASSMDDVWHNHTTHGYIRWPVNADETFRGWFGYDIMDKLKVFRAGDSSKLPAEEQEVRVDYFDFLTRRLREAYFVPVRDWAREHDLASGGHVQNTPSYFHFSHLLRLLRTIDVPGHDVVWRQILPGQANHHVAKFVSSATHQNGTALALTESFCVYGNGLTPAQMKWVVDYQYVRGLTLLVCGNFPLSTRDHLMQGERPHFGPVDPLWDFLPDFHRYVARLGYVLSCGKPPIEIGLYYPARDITASGNHGDPALHGHDALARALFERQCDFDVIDDDVLTDTLAHVENGHLVVGAMRYRTIVVGPTHWMKQEVQQQLKTLGAAGGQVLHVEDDPKQIDAAMAKIAPTMQFDPPSPDLRVLVRRWPGGGAAFLFNEGQRAYGGTASVKLEGNPQEIEPATGLVRSVKDAQSSDGQWTIPVALGAGESMLLVSNSQEKPAEVAPPAIHKVVQSVDLADGWTARADRQYVVGEHDFEVRKLDKAEFQPASLGRWAETLSLGEDFSGHVTYRRTVKVPEALRGGRLVLDLGGVEYAARVRVDGQNVGCVLWSPWHIELPTLKNPSEFVLEIEVSSTLANELSSQRVHDAWSKRKGPGWPGPYHAQAAKFEMDSRGGGLVGPVQLQLATP
jgi:hypothetical protein